MVPEEVKPRVRILGTHCTSGIVAVMFQDQVLIKAIAQCHGERSAQLLDALMSCEDLSRDVVYKQARRIGFGCDDCLVVSDRSGDLSAVKARLSPLYAEKFNDPDYNPENVIGFSRWTEQLKLDDNVVLYKE